VNKQLHIEYSQITNQMFAQCFIKSSNVASSAA